MKKAKSAAKKQSKINPEHVFYVMDRKHTLDELSTHAKNTIMSEAKEIEMLCETHNALIDNANKLDIVNKPAIKGLASSIERFIDMSITELNHYIEISFNHHGGKRNEKSKKLRKKANKKRTK